MCAAAGASWGLCTFVALRLQPPTQRALLPQNVFLALCARDEHIVQLVLRHLTTPLWEEDAARVQHVCAANDASRQLNVCRSARRRTARRLCVRADCLRRP
jgi:hypothetical protein